MQAGRAEAGQAQGRTWAGSGPPAWAPPGEDLGLHSLNHMGVIHKRMSWGKAGDASGRPVDDGADGWAPQTPLAWEPGRVGDRSHVLDAVAVLTRGGLVAFPTETVYGLGADASNAEAVARIFRVKGRPAGHPLICLLYTSPSPRDS